MLMCRPKSYQLSLRQNECIPIIKLEGHPNLGQDLERHSVLIHKDSYILDPWTRDYSKSLDENHYLGVVLERSI